MNSLSDAKAHVGFLSHQGSRARSAGDNATASRLDAAADALSAMIAALTAIPVEGLCKGVETVAQALRDQEKLTGQHYLLKRAAVADEAAAALRAYAAREADRARVDAEVRPTRKPNGSGPCSLGVGCDETGFCYAIAHGHPEECGAAKPNDEWPSGWLAKELSDASERVSKWPPEIRAVYSNILIGYDENGNALPATITEVERLTAPLGDEGRELLEDLRDLGGIPACKDAAAYIERQAAREADRARVDAEVRDATDAYLDALSLSGEWQVGEVCPECKGKRYIAGVTAWPYCGTCKGIGKLLHRAILDTAKPAKTPGNGGRWVLDVFKPLPQDELDALKAVDPHTWGQLDTAKPAKPAPDLARLRREVEALPASNSDFEASVSYDAVLAIIDREQEAGE